MSDDARLASVMREAGVTRLAELTGLDRVGIPVWQAVRPMSRALSVHQGKALDDTAARRGAAMEAIECHHAEQWEAPEPPLRATWGSLAKRRRVPACDDFARRRRTNSATILIDWVLAEPLVGERFYVPFDSVSLDCTIDPSPGVVRDSSGQAAHFTLDGAIKNALLELIERDAVAEWFAAPLAGRCGAEIDPRTLGDPEFAVLAERIAAAGIGLRLFRVPAVVPVPVYAAELDGRRAGTDPHEHAWGSAAAFDPVEAVLKAMLEALQIRCTHIAGSRDTIPLSPVGGLPRYLALPRNPGWRGHRFTADTGAAHDLAGLIAALVCAGFGQVGYIRLSPWSSAAVTVKTFVPGLGLEERRRRRP